MGNQLEIAIENILEIARGAKYYHFESGCDNPFSIEFHKIMDDVVDPYIYFHLQTILLDPSKEYMAEDVKCELIKQIACINDPNSIHIRRVLIQQCFDLPTLNLRDSAILAIAHIDDPLSLPALYVLYDREKNDEAKVDIKQVIDQLIDTQTEIDAKSTDK